MGAAAAIGGALGAVGGLINKPKNKDMGVYGMNAKQRTGLGDAGHKQLMGQYATDPNAYWGGEKSWTTSGGMGPAGGLTWNHLVGGGGGGGGGARAGYAKASLAKVAMGLEDPTYSLEQPKDQEDRLLAKSNEMGSAQAGDSWRRMQDEMTRGGSSGSSPAAMALQAQIERQRMKGSSDALRDTRINWADSSRQLRHGWNELATGVNVSNAGNETQVSMGNAANETAASSTNAGIGESAAGREAAAAQFLMGARGRDEDRMLERYQGLNGMNMGWQKPVNQMEQQQSGLSRMLQGASAGFGSSGGDSGGFGGMIANMFKRKGKPNPGAYAAQAGNSYGAYPSGGNNYVSGLGLNPY